MLKKVIGEDLRFNIELMGSYTDFPNMINVINKWPREVKRTR